MMKKLWITCVAAALLAAGNLPPQAVVAAAKTETVVNPMVEYESLVELQYATVFIPLPFPQSFGVRNVSYFVIGGEVAELQGRDLEGHRVSLRTVEGVRDITGVYGAVYKDLVIDRLCVQIGAVGTVRAAWWSDGMYSYAYTADGISAERFDAQVRELVANSKSGAFYGANGLPCGVTLYRDIRLLEKDAGFTAMMLPHVFRLAISDLGMADGQIYVSYDIPQDVQAGSYIELRTSRSSETICPLKNDLTLLPKKVNGVSVHSGKGEGPYQGLHVAWWTNGALSYCAIARGHSDEEFDTLLSYMTNH